MITSRQNAQIKFLRSLSEKKFRDQTGLYIVEGLKSVSDAYLYGEKIDKVFFTESGKQLFFATYPEIKVAEYELLSDDVFKCVSGEVTPQGVLATVSKKVPTLSAGNCLFLDGVSDPSNVGAIIRTAACANFLNVFIANGADAYSPKAVRASMGGIFRVNIFVGEREELLEKINLPIVVADMNGRDVFGAKIDGNFCLAVGNEAHGVSELLRKRAKYTFKIPMQNGMESLNAGVAASILMYAIKNN